MIFLTILKVIGIILLIVLAILLLAVLALLFCPFRYRLAGSIDHKDYSLEGKVSWLFNLAAIYIYYDKGLNTRIRILFFNKNLSDGKRQNEPKTDNEGQTESDNIIEDNQTSYVAAEAPQQDENSPNPTGFSPTEGADVKSKDIRRKKVNKKRPRKRRKKGGKLSGLKNKLSEIKKKLSRPESKAALNKLKNEFFKLLKRIVPDKLYLDLVFSTGQPDKTGLALGILAMFPIGYINRWKICPDFESDEFYLKGKWNIRGRIRMITPLVCGLRILLDKNCRKLYNEFK